MRAARLQSRMACCLLLPLVLLSACEEEMGGALVAADLAVPIEEDLAAPPDPDADLAAPDLRALPTGPDLTKIVPWKAVNLLGPTDRVWSEFDYRPKAQGGLREDIDARLDKLRQIGVRQVQVQTMFSWSVETAPYAGTSLQSTVYYKPAYKPDDPSTWGKVPRNRRGDMGLIAYQPPAYWDVPTPLKNPLEINRKAEQVLGELLDAIAAHGLVPVLKTEIYLTIAEDGNGTSQWFNFTDPSRNFDQFYAKYQEYLVAMARVAARHQAAMLVLGTETPYVAGAGQAYFADGSKMTDRQAMIYGKWKGMLAAVRQTLRDEGRLDIVLSYTEINPFWEERRMSEPRAAIWTKVPFWDDLDAVGINFYLPGRFSDGMGGYDRTPKTAQDMVAYGETHNFQTDFVPNMADIKAFFVGKKGYDLTKKPVFFAEDGCTSSPTAAANPAAPPFLTIGAAPDFTEQKNLYEAHFILFEKYGAGWLAGLGFWQATPTARWGGAWNPADRSNYGTAAAYFSFIGTPTEDVVKKYFARY